MSEDKWGKAGEIIAKIIFFGLMIFFVTLSMIHIEGPEGEARLNQHKVFKFFYCTSHILGCMAGCAR